MSNSKREKLLTQLKTDDNPKTRRKACQKLAATRDPAVIPALRDAYKNDEDEKVKAIAQDALARFKGSQKRGGAASSILKFFLGILILAFVGSLVLHAMEFLSSDEDDDNNQTTTAANSRPLQVTDRNQLILTLGSKLSEAQALNTSLRNEINKYNNTGQVDCAMAYGVPPRIELGEDDRATYPDIRLISETFNAVQSKFEIALKLLEVACDIPDEQTDSVVKAAQRLDEVDAQLDEVNTLLQQAITNPAPTVWPTSTPMPPTATLTPPPATQIPTQDTAQQSTDATAVIAAPDTSAPDAQPTQAEAMPPTATLTPLPAATLPFPALNYPSLSAEFNERFSQDFLLDLQNPYGTGMLNQWQQALSDAGQTTTNYCPLTTWPEAFTLSAEQQALLNTPGVADPQLEELLQLQQDAFALANQARALYERDCTETALANSAEQGSELVREAVEKLDRAQDLLNEISTRP